MEPTQLNDSEIKIMEVLWREGPLPAKELALRLGGSTGWNKNTTYTLLRRLLEKGALSREEPGFHCRALVTRAQVERAQSAALADKLFAGSASRLLAALCGGKRLPPEEVARLQRLIDEMK